MSKTTIPMLIMATGSHDDENDEEHKSLSIHFTIYILLYTVYFVWKSNLVFILNCKLTD